MLLFNSANWMLELSPQFLLGIHCPNRDKDDPVIAIHIGPFILTYWN